MPRFLWTDDRRRRANSLWASGASSSLIAAQLQTTEKSVRNYISRVKLHRFHAKPMPSYGERPGLTHKVVAYLEGIKTGFLMSGLHERAAEVDSDMAELQRIAVTHGIVVWHL